MSQPIFVVDAFTDRPFAGNPAAVCVLAAPASEAWMRDVAREMNLAETAFLHRVGEAFALRWFTPTVEVDLCGHATLASAHVLWEEAHLVPGEMARFETRSGRLTAVQAGDGIELDFPRAAAEAVPAPADLLPGLGLGAARWVGRNRFDYLVEVGGETEVRTLAPNFHALRSLGIRGVIVTSLADPGRPYDFVSRFFAPGAGIDEDPVTGSAHCALGPYWGARLGRDALTGYQASARGGTVHVTCRGDRVLLGGQAVTVLRASLL
ncbi:MAG: PhzF family phenazine biosynthesis protein [Gemmatimonadetes bacterium]|nr:PhzF family phenazine biosynthesis protein [Gemmatimonadota bacterium]MBP9201416.1 PhzF family phenazine biosynthesis protein [Gemmatimonadales bacterium]MBK6778256.1 PhzF family phenazine biosynthesis protein [Gemmatimonadota bacterium]MBK7349434.1 PhzF family phenazine biosynthesis protein [Gemmatimonadota bacterium]MBK7716447.1 PhzF family phenazine biosynthesis protein [Gemmatimonadota bacterium]